MEHPSPSRRITFAGRWCLTGILEVLTATHLGCLTLEARRINNIAFRTPDCARPSFLNSFELWIPVGVLSASSQPGTRLVRSPVLRKLLVLKLLRERRILRAF